jgi:hypothetical protein
VGYYPRELVTAGSIRSTIERAHNLVNEFYKKGCQEKTSPSTGGREDFCLDIQPTVCKCPRFSSRDFALACLSFLWVSSFGGDDANRVLKLGKRTLVLEGQPWFYRRLVAYRYFWLSEEA